MAPTTVFQGTGTGLGIALAPATGVGQTLTTQVVLGGTGTIAYLATEDGQTWVNLLLSKQDTAGTSTSITASGIYSVDVTGRLAVRPSVTANSTSMTITSTISAGSGGAGGGGGGGGGGAVTIADGANVVEGTTTDIAYTDATGAAAGTMESVLKGLFVELAGTLKVGGTTVPVGVEISRPGDTNIYAAGDSVNTSTSAPTIVTWALGARIASGTGYITKARLVTDQPTCVAQIRLHLYLIAAPTLTNDNAAFNLPYADAGTTNYLGYIDFPAFVATTGGNCAISQADNIRLQFKAAANQSVYGVYQTQTIFTPANAQKFFGVLAFEQN